MKSLFRPSLFVFLLAVLCALSTFVMAQDVASLTGVVTDSSGAVVSDATVKVLDTRTNTSYEAKTNSLGAYSINRLQPGPGYLITVSKEGFETVKIADVYLAVNATHTQNAQLKIGSTTETVEVSGVGSAVTLDTTDTTIGNNFDIREVHDLPIQFRDSIASLAQFQPGVAVSAGVDDPNNSRSGAVTGSRIDQGNITLDGLDVNDFGTGQAFTATANAPVDSIQEFRGESANPLAAEGRGAGQQITLVTKSGTNQLPRIAFRISAQYRYRSERFLQYPRWHSAHAAQPQPVRRDLWRTDQEGQGLLLHQLQRPPGRADRQRGAHCAPGQFGRAHRQPAQRRHRLHQQQPGMRLRTAASTLRRTALRNSRQPIWHKSVHLHRPYGRRGAHDVSLTVAIRWPTI